jgi:hypothetical protein
MKYWQPTSKLFAAGVVRSDFERTTPVTARIVPEYLHPIATLN